MNSKVLSIVVKAQDQASKVLDRIGNSTTGMRDKVKSAAAGMAVLATGAGAALYGITGALKSTITAANRSSAALMGLTSIARAFGIDANDAKNAAQSLAKDGLMTVGDAATGLKNLLAAGFELPQAIQLMERFKDSAAFGRQSSLEFGQAITSATEGIKNGNSILVDNAGVTKNLSMMLTDAGYSAQDLMKASSDAGVRMAIYNGILKETNAQQGDAARLATTFAGKQAMVGAQFEVMKQKIGSALQEALLPLVEKIAPILTALANWVGQNQRLVAALTIATVVTLGIVTVLGALVAAVGGVIAIFGVAGAPIIAAVLGISIAIGAFVALATTKFGYMKHIVEGFQAAITWAGNAIRQAFTIAKPAIDILKAAMAEMWAVVQSQLVPALSKLWQQIGPMLTPVLKVLAAIMVGQMVAAIVAVVAVLYVIIKAVSMLISVISSVIGAVARFVGAFRNAASGAYNAVATYISQIPGRIMSAVSQMISIVVGLGGRFASAFGSMGQNAVNSIMNALGSLPGRVASVIGDAMGQVAAAPGNIAKSIESKLGVDIPGFAAGGFTGRGGTNQAAGIVHKGEYVIPKKYVNQETGTPMVGGGGPVFNMYGTIQLNSAGSVDRFFDRINAQKELGNLGTGV